MHSLNALIRRWASQDVGSLPAERAGAVAETFAVLGSIATADVIHMYSISGGMENMDNEYWRYWPLSEIRAENKESSPFGILFADYLISSWCYRLKPVSNETSAVYLDRFDGTAPSLVAGSLQEFFDAFLADARRLLDPLSKSAPGDG